MNFITLQGIIEDHNEIITIYGGAYGIRDLGLLAAAIEMPKATMFGKDLHPSLFDKAAAYLFHILQNHPFVDGNKRTGTAAAITFLWQNQIPIQFSKKQSLLLEELIVDTASGKIRKKEISDFFIDCYNPKNK